MIDFVAGTSGCTRLPHRPAAVVEFCGGRRAGRGLRSQPECLVGYWYKNKEDTLYNNLSESGKEKRRAGEREREGKGRSKDGCLLSVRLHRDSMSKKRRGSSPYKY